MAKKKYIMIYLDTHVVVWLYEGLLEKLSSHAKHLLENNELFISPILELELNYLHEIKKIRYSSQPIINELQLRIGLKICDIPFTTIINKAHTLAWTRDPFDRIMVAQAMCANAKFLTKDEFIRKHSKIAVWD